MIQIFRDSEYDYYPEDYEVVGEYDPETETWVLDERGLSDVYPEGTPPEVILRAFNGPTYIAVDTREEGQPLERSGHDVGPAAVAEQVSFDAYVIDPEDEEEVDKSWEHYRGPLGGEGWINLLTGEVRYQTKRPDDEEGIDAETEHLASMAAHRGDPDDLAEVVSDHIGGDPEQIVEESRRPDGEVATRDMIADTVEFIEEYALNPTEMVGSLLEDVIDAVPDRDLADVPEGEVDEEGMHRLIYTSEKSGRVIVDSVAEVPDDKIAHVTVDEEGDVEEVYYES